MAINMKKITARARDTAERDRILAEKKGPRVELDAGRRIAGTPFQDREEAITALRQRTRSIGQRISPFQSREEALEALQREEPKAVGEKMATRSPRVSQEQALKKWQTRALEKMQNTVKQDAGPQIGPAPAGMVNAVTDKYGRNSEKTKRAAWEQSRKDYTSAEKELPKWQEERERLRIPEEAWKAKDAGVELTDEQRSVISIWGDSPEDRKEVAEQIAQADAEIARLQGVMDANHDSFVNGYDSIQNERAERYKGVVSDVEVAAEQMLPAGKIGEWANLWQKRWKEATESRDKLTQDVMALEQSSADASHIAEARERLSWVEDDVQALKDVSVLLQPDYAQKSQAMEGVNDTIYNMVNGSLPPTWATAQGAGYDAMMDLYKRFRNMTEAERGTYNYLYAFDPKNAMAYLDRIANRLVYRETQRREAGMAEVADTFPVLSTVASTMYSPFETVAGVSMGLAALTGNEVNPYNEGFNPVRDKAAIRDAVTEKISNPLGQFAYGVGTSMADVGVASLLGGGSNGLPGLSSALMALPAGAAKGMEMLESGADMGTAALGGAAVAGAEWATEKLGFDRLYGSFTSGKMSGTYKDMLKAALTGFFAEGSEETLSAIVNEPIDRWLMGENSQRVQLIRQGVESGLSVDDAIKEADWTLVKTLGENFLAGGVAGGLMQGGSYVSGVASAKAATQQIIKELPGLDQNLVQAAMEMEARVRTRDEATVNEAYAQIEAEQEKQAEKQNHAVFEAPAVANGVQGVISGVQKSGAEAEVLVRQNGKEIVIPLGEVQFQNEEQRQAYGFAVAYADESTARQFLAGYEKSNAPIRNYAKGFAAAYAAGRNNRALIGAEKVWAKAVPDTIREMAYAAGQKSVEQEEARLDMDPDVDSSIRKRVHAMPRTVTADYTGAVNQVRRSTVSKSQATQMALLDSLGKKYGTQYIFVDSFQENQAANQHLGAAAASVQNGRINGVYKTGTNQMVIALDAEGGNLLRAAGHESWHYIKEHSQKNDYVRGDADALQGFVLEKLQGVEGYDLETRIAQKQDQYKRMAGQELDRDAAVEEIVADSLVEVLATEQNVRDLMEQHTTLGEKVMGFIKRFLGDIRETLRKLGGKNVEARAMLEQDEKTLQQIAEHFDRVMIEVNAVRKSGSAAQGDGGVKYAIKTLPDGKEYVEESRSVLSGNDPAKWRGQIISYINHEIRNGHDVTVYAGDGTPLTITRDTAGKAAFRNQIIMKDGTKRLMTDEEYAVKLRAEGHIDEIAQTSRIQRAGIPDRKNHAFAKDGFDYRTAYWKDQTGYYKLDFSVGKNGTLNTVYNIGKIKETEFPGAKARRSSKAQMGKSVNNSVSQTKQTVKNKFSLSDAGEAQQTNTAAFKRWFGDSVVVNEDGSPKVMYHGTPYGDFTVFKGWQYFTDDKSYADKYHNPGASSIRGRYPEVTNKKTYAVYLSVKKPFDTRLPEVREIWENEFFGSYSRTPLSEKGLPDWTDGIELVEFIEENEYDFDGIILDEGATGGYGDEVQSRGVSVVVRESSQIKSATENVGTYDPKNPDIRYSLRDVDAFNPEMEMLLEENRELRDLVRGLNTQLKQYSGRAADEKTVRRVASGLKKKYASTVPLNTLTENLMRAFNAMQSAENTRQSEAAMEMMGNIALDMVQKSQIADREAYDASRDLRERFRKSRIGLTDTQWQEAESLYDTARDFRRAVFGKWNVPAQNGRGVTTLDMIWDDLVAEYPQYFSADASEGDMVQQVLDMLDATAIKYDNPFGAEIEQVASGVATEIYQEYLGTEDFSGAKDEAVDRLMDQLADAKKTILEQKRGLRRANRDIADMRVKREAQALRRRQNQDYNQVKNEIIRKKGQLLKKLEAPKSGAFIPASMHDAVHELLKAIDFEGKLSGETNKPLTREMMDRARDEYKKLNLPDENGGTGPLAAFYNGDLEHDFNLLSVEADGLRAKELSMKHMQALRNIVAGYAAAIINEDRMFMQNRRESLQETGDDLLLSMSTNREHTVQGKVREWFSKGLQQGLLKPVTVFHQFKGTAMEPVWKALRNAEGKHIRHVEEATAYLEEALGEYEQHKSIKEEGTRAKRDKAKEITFENGTKMKLTDQELMTLYATARREKLVGTQHLEKGGFTLANAPKGSSMRPVVLTARDIQTINSSLTQQQREYVDHMVNYLSGTCADWGNEVTMELYGVEKFHEEYYIPFSVNKNYVKVEPATEQDSRIKTGSFTKALTANASNPLEIKPFTEIWCQHAEKMSDYNAFVLPIEDMTRLMNYKGDGDGVKATMNRAYGKQTTDYIMHFLRRLNGNSRNEMGESWLGGFMGRAKGAAVTFNLSVAIQQAGSAPRAMAMIDPRHFMAGLAKAVAHGKVDNHRAIGAAYAELEKYAPIAVEKGWGYFDTNMSRGMYQRAQNTTMNKLNDAGGKLAEWGDKITWAIIWEAVKTETADTYKEVMVGSEEYYQLCADRFQDVIDHTQVVDSIFQRAEFAAEKGMMKNFMAFMSEPITTYNMMYRAVYDVSQAKDKMAKAKAMGRFGRTITAFAVSSALTAAFKSVVMALRDRDNEKKDEDGNIIGVRDYWDKYLESLPGAVLDNLLGVGTVFTNAISDAMSGFGGGSDLTTGWIGNLFTGGKQMFDMLTGNRDSTLENWEKAMYKMLQGSSSAVGIGFGNLWRDVKSIGLTAFEIVEQDSLAGTAWDKTVHFETRLAAAQKNYVYKKQPGDNRKQNTGIYYDLMLTAYFEDGGMYENYEAAADAAIATGATAKGVATAFKTRLRAAEDRIPMAAAALVEGNMETYQRCVEELQEAGIGMRAISSMILSEVNDLEPKEAEGSGTGADVISELLREDESEDPVYHMQKEAYNRATTPQALKAAVDDMRKSGTTDKDLRTKVTTSYRKTYCQAVWNGDAKAAREAAAMMKGAGVGITDDDLADWTSGLSGSYASEQLHQMIKAGDGKSAVKIRAVMYKAHGQAETNKAIENYVKKYCVGKENVDEANVKKALLALGYSQQTINGWFKK